MAYCTGNPSTTDHCCWLGGQRCPHHLAETETETRAGGGWTGGTRTAAEWFLLDELDRRGINQGSVRNVALKLVGGQPNQCAQAIVAGLDWYETSGGVPDGTARAAWAALWSARYAPGADAAAVGDHWATIGRPRDWCVSFGPAEGHCCFAQGDSQTAAAEMSVEIRGLRQAIEAE